jgi:hypothetical protein
MEEGPARAQDPLLLVGLPQGQEVLLEVKARTQAQLPDEYGCNLCNLTKPVGEMIVVFLRSEKLYYLRPRCKDCHNKRERGHRRGYKTNYLQRWRSRNKALDDSYWREDPNRKEAARLRAQRRNAEKHDEIAIQRRLSKRGIHVTIKEAQGLLAKYGRCYPTRFGLTAKGLQECERICCTQRRSGRKRFSAFEIRLMVYEDGLFIKPSKQPVPYQKSAEKLREWQRRQRESAERRAA